MGIPYQILLDFTSYYVKFLSFWNAKKTKYWIPEHKDTSILVYFV